MNEEEKNRLSLNYLQSLENRLTQSKLRRESLFTLETLLYFSPTYYKYALPSLATLYIMFTISVFVVFRKLKMFGFVQVVRLVSNIVETIPMFSLAILNAVLVNIMDAKEPMPYPLCTIYMISNNYVRSSTHLVSVYLKILLAVNRFCSIYYPLKTPNWFTKRLCKIYCFIITACILSLGTYLKSSTFDIQTKRVIGDVWKKGIYEMFDACTMDNYEILQTASFESTIQPRQIKQIAEFLVLSSGLAIIVGLNISILIKMKRIAATRKLLMETGSHQYKNNTRVFLLNKVMVWVLSAFALIQIPLLIQHTFILCQIIFLISNNRSMFTMSFDITVTTSRIAGVFVDIVIPFELTLFIICSRKARKGIVGLFLK